MVSSSPLTRTWRSPLTESVPLGFTATTIELTVAVKVSAAVMSPLPVVALADEALIRLLVLSSG